MTGLHLNENWNQVTNLVAHQITGSTANPGNVYRYPVDQLPASLQKMPGIYDAYISGYMNPYTSSEGVVVQGELVVARVDKGLGKGYVFPFGVSTSGVYTAGPIKPYDGHHFDTASGVPIDKLFGKIEPPETTRS